MGEARHIAFIYQREGGHLHCNGPVIVRSAQSGGKTSKRVYDVQMGTTRFHSLSESIKPPKCRHMVASSYRLHFRIIAWFRDTREEAVFLPCIELVASLSQCPILVEAEQMTRDKTKRTFISLVKAGYSCATYQSPSSCPNRWSLELGS